jgi:ABC-type antimicrobial peptide transport system permease subunit
LIISLSSKTSAAYVYVKFSDKVSHQEALKKISEEHLKIFGTNKMQFEFLTDIIDRFYTHDIYIRKFLLFGSVIMLVISCVGLYGVSSYIVLQRTKEISLRKVLGASQVQVIALHLMPFINLLLITFPLACFGSYYFSMIWLQTFTHRAPIDVTNFMLPLLANLGILVLVIIGHAIKLSRVNPAETLKVQ